MFQRHRRPSPHPSIDTLNADDKDLPVHRVSRVEDRERLLAEAMAHAEAMEEQYKVIPADAPLTGRWKSPVAVLMFATAAVVGLFPPAWLAGPVLPRPTQGDQDRGLRAAIYIQAQQVEAFRLEHGRLPDHPRELANPLPDLTLVRSNNRIYQVRGVATDGRVVVYDSARPSPAFRGAAVWQEEPPR